ncbi:MAG: restriction endonuclease subunit S [Candidatus Micrarchaeota archaeon]
MILPKGWGEKELGDVCEIVMGQSPPSNTYNENKVGIPFFQGKAEFGDRYPSPKKWCNAPSKIANKNDILISVRAPVGATNISNSECCIGRGLAALRPKENLTLFFLCHILKMKEAEISKSGQGSTFSAITGSQLRKIKIPIPPLPTQHKIVTILEKAESIKQKRQQIEALTNQVLQSVFIEMFGDPETNPRSWKKIGLGTICEITSGGTPNRSRPEYYEGGTISWVKSGEVNNKYVFDTEEKITETGLQNSSAKYFEPNTILVAMYGATAGKIAVLKIKATTNQAIAGLTCDTKLVHYEYIHHCLERLANRLISQCVGAAQPNLSQQIIKKLEIPVPTLDLQQKFSKIVERVELIKQKQLQNQKYSEELFNSLMQKAFSGELVK